MPGGISDYHIWCVGVIPNAERPGMLINILQCTGQLPTTTPHTNKNYLAQKVVGNGLDSLHYSTSSSHQITQNYPFQNHIFQEYSLKRAIRYQVIKRFQFVDQSMERTENSTRPWHWLNIFLFFKATLFQLIFKCWYPSVSHLTCRQIMLAIYQI